MQIVFHAGFHKTGTTSLQAALEAHAPHLSPHVQVQTRRLSQAFVKAAESARAYSRQPSAQALGSFAKDMDDWAAGLTHAPLIASSEDFAGHMPMDRGVKDYSAALETVPVIVQALRKRFAQARIAVLFTTRATEPWLRSLHWQLAKKPVLTLMQRRFCRDYQHLAAFDTVLGPLAERLTDAQLHIQPLEALTGRRLGPVDCVYDLVGLPDDLRAQLGPVRVANQSPPGNLADQFIRLNRAKLPAAELEETKRLMLRMMHKLTDEGAG